MEERATIVLGRRGEVMSTASVSDDGGWVSGGKSADGWRAEEAVAGNRRALEALRELVAYPFLYARESRLLGLKVMCSRLLPPSDFAIVCYTFGLIIQLCFLQWPRGLLLHGPPGTGKVLSFQFLALTLSSIFHHLKRTLSQITLKCLDCNFLGGV